MKNRANSTWWENITKSPFPLQIFSSGTGRVETIV